MRSLSTDEFLSVTGIPYTKLYDVKRSYLKPVRDGAKGRLLGGKGAGNVAEWSAVQALAIAVSRGMRLIGVSVPHSIAVAKYLMTLSEEQLEAEFTAGRTHIGSIGPWAFAALSSREEILENKAVLQKSLSTVGIMPTAIDVQRVWENLQAAVAEFDRRKEVVQKNVQPRLEPSVTVGT